MLTLLPAWTTGAARTAEPVRTIEVRISSVRNAGAENAVPSGSAPVVTLVPAFVVTAVKLVVVASRLVVATEPVFGMEAEKTVPVARTIGVTPVPAFGVGLGNEMPVARTADVTVALDTATIVGAGNDVPTARTAVVMATLLVVVIVGAGKALATASTAGTSTSLMVMTGGGSEIVPDSTDFVRISSVRIVGVANAADTARSTVVTPEAVLTTGVVNIVPTVSVVGTTLAFEAAEIVGAGKVVEAVRASGTIVVPLGPIGPMLETAGSSNQNGPELMTELFCPKLYPVSRPPVFCAVTVCVSVADVESMLRYSEHEITPAAGSPVI